MGGFKKIKHISIIILLLVLINLIVTFYHIQSQYSLHYFIIHLICECFNPSLMIKENGMKCEIKFTMELTSYTLAVGISLTLTAV